MNIFRTLRLVFQLLPQPCYVHVDSSRRHVTLIFPNLLKQLFAWNDGASLLHQIAKQLKLLPGQADRSAGLPTSPLSKFTDTSPKRYE